MQNYKNHKRFFYLLSKILCLILSSLLFNFVEIFIHIFGLLDSIHYQFCVDWNWVCVERAPLKDICQETSSSDLCYELQLKCITIVIIRANMEIIISRGNVYNIIPLLTYRDEKGKTKQAKGNLHSSAEPWSESAGISN